MTDLENSYCELTAEDSFESDGCVILFDGIIDQGLLVHASAFLSRACGRDRLGDSARHLVIPDLYCLRHALELTLIGCEQALKNAGCQAKPESYSGTQHSLCSGFTRWKVKLEEKGNTSNLDIDLIWDNIAPFDEDSEPSRIYRYKLPDLANWCEAQTKTRRVILDLAEVTSSVLPSEHSDCIKKLKYLQWVACEPCSLPEFEDFDPADYDIVSDYATMLQRILSEYDA